MSETVLSCFSRLTPDPWREGAGFSDDIEAVHRELFSDEQSEARRVAVLSEWIQTKQTCLFGRAAAKLGALSYCVLTEADLQESDEAIREKIQTCRLQWTREAFEGKKSGFIVWMVSPRIALAEPSAEMLELAQRICELYLDREIEPDRIYLDEIFLEKPGSRKTTWKWFAGVNYFCSQGDKRWWHDHRIPGGMAFSVNSVGHLVKSSIIPAAQALNLATETAPPATSADNEKWLAVRGVLSKEHIRKRVRLPITNDSHLSVLPLNLKAIQHASLDVHLGNWFSYARRTKLDSVKLPDEKEKLATIGREEVFIPKEKDFLLHPGDLVLGVTQEFFGLPNDVMAFVEGKSGLGRLGLFVATATQVAPGYHGVIVLELANAGTVPLKLSPGMEIAQLVFQVMTNSTPSYRGEYQCQIKP